jgi:hypothetical protein
VKTPRFLVPFLAATALLSGGTAHASTLPRVGTATVGNDIGWPNCPVGMGIPERRTRGNPMPSASAKHVIIGLTNGPGFTPNPCLASQIAWVKARHLWTGVYSVISYPTAAQLSRYGGTGTLGDKLYRTGVAQARYNLANLHRAGLARVPMVWVDVEPVRGWPWSSSTARNNKVISGALAGYQAAGLRVGLYSYQYGWNEITGGRRQATMPTWVPLRPCTTASFSGGPVWLTQTTSGDQDINTTCPVMNGTPARPNPLTRYLGTVLRQGSRGAAVVALQRRLSLTADGVFGAKTRAKVIAVQQARHLPATGVVEDRLWRSLGAGTDVAGRPSLFPKAFAST